jgi:hypothetical protein
MYHFTDEAEDILANGFQGEDAYWFAPARHTICGEKSRKSLLEVEFDLTDEELKQYRHIVKDEDMEEEGIGSLPGQVNYESEPYDYYKIPDDVVKQRMTSRRKLSDEERKARIE